MGGGRRGTSVLEDTISLWTASTAGYDAGIRTSTWALGAGRRELKGPAFLRGFKPVAQLFVGTSWYLLVCPWVGWGMVG